MSTDLNPFSLLLTSNVIHVYYRVSGVDVIVVAAARPVTHTGLHPIQA